jgi:hypothetical protein
MHNPLFVIVIAAEILTLVALVVSILLPENRIWPPKRQNSWGQYAMLALFIVTATGIILLGILDWGSYAIPSWIRIPGLILSPRTSS